MILSNLSQQFVIHFSHNFFYPEINEKWLPIIRRMGLPYVTMEDFMNAQIQTITFPGINMPEVTQQSGAYLHSKRNSKTLDQNMVKDLTITFKLTESYISYFVMREQMDLYFKVWDETKPLYWDAISVDLLDDFGNATITYQEEQITPVSISDLSLSYSARVGSYNTFTLSMKFNYFSIFYNDNSEGNVGNGGIY